jgi:hypothetical protein
MPYGFRKSSGSLAMFVAIRRASSRVRCFIERTGPPTEGGGYSAGFPMASTMRSIR